MTKSETRFGKYTWFVLLCVLLVILWGAFVRATGSGAGCGNHWPLCNGEIIPRSPGVETLIEFSHRLSSGIAFILVVFLVVYAFRIFPTGSRVRSAALVALFFMITEALVGAGLVLFGLVADDDSFTRAWVMAFHLVNTFLLLASLTLCAWWTYEKRPLDIRGNQSLRNLLFLSFALVLLLGISGAIAALGDTLFPSTSLEEALAEDFSPTAHLLIRLRIYHPLIAFLTAFVVLITTVRIGKQRQELFAMAALTGGLYLAQLAVGLINLFLLAPVSLQLLHLLMADIFWISLVILGVSALTEPDSRMASAEPAV